MSLSFGAKTRLFDPSILRQVNFRELAGIVTQQPKPAPVQQPNPGQEMAAPASANTDGAQGTSGGDGSAMDISPEKGGSPEATGMTRGVVSVSFAPMLCHLLRENQTRDACPATF